MEENNCAGCSKAEIDCNCISVENPDGTLQTIVLGCMDSAALNYNPLANCDDGSCIAIIQGCMDPISLNYSACHNADCDGNLPGSAEFIAGGDYGVDTCCCTVQGCMDSSASNYNDAACIDNGSCTYPGCMDNLACNYDPSANISTNTCIYPPQASVTATACNSYTWALTGLTYTTSGIYTHVTSGYCPTTTTLNLTINLATSNTVSHSACGSYFWPISGSTYTVGGIYTEISTNEFGCTHLDTLNLEIKLLGCTDPNALNYNPLALCDDGSCIAAVSGCTDPQASNYNAAANVSTPTCTYSGCTNSLATNYGWTPAGQTYASNNSTWTITANNQAFTNGSFSGTAIDDGSCILCVYGCTDPTALNYNASATCDDGSCTYDIFGCTDPTACNYDPLATADDGSCISPPSLDLGATNFGVNDPNSLYANATGASGFPAATYGISAYPYIAGEPMFGAHITKMWDSNGTIVGNFALNGTGNHTGNARTESYYFLLGTGNASSSNPPLVVNQTYCISWAEIVLKLTTYGQCSDCLIGGWDVRIDNGTTTPDESQLNSATSLYNPVTGVVLYGTSPGLLTTANALYHNSLPEKNVVNGQQNTAGASNGSYSQWNQKCITFKATQAQHRIHIIAMTDFNQCTSCTHDSNSSVHGAYIGITNVKINTGCTGDCNC